MKTTVVVILSFILQLTLMNLRVQGQQLELVVHTGHSGRVMSATFSPDGKILASSGDDSTVKLWDIETGLQIKELSTQGSIYFQPANFTEYKSADTRLIKGEDVFIEWHFVNVLFYGTGPISKYLRESLTSRTRSLLNKYHVRPTVELLTALTEDLNRILKSDSLYAEERFKDVILSSETRALLARSPVGEALVKLNRSLLEDAYPGQLAQVQGQFEDLIFSHNGKLLAGKASNGLRIWAIETGKEISIPQIILGQMAFSPDDKILAVVHSDDVILYDAATGALIKKLVSRPITVKEGTSSFLESNYPETINFSSDGNVLFIIGTSRTSDDSNNKETALFIEYFDINKGVALSKTTRRFTTNINTHNFNPRNLQASGDGKSVINETTDEVKDASGNVRMKYSVNLFNLDAEKSHTIVEGYRPADVFDQAKFNSQQVSSSFSFDSQVLAVARDRTIGLYSPKSGAKIKDYNLDFDITGLSWSNDNSRLAILSGDTVAIFNLKEGKTTGTLINHSRRVKGSFDRVSKKLIFERGDDDYQAFDLTNGTINSAVSGIEAVENILVVSRKWNIDTGEIFETTEKKMDALGEYVPQFVSQRYISPGGKIFAEPAGDKINLLDTKTETVIRVLSGHIDEVITVIFSPDGKILASGSHDNTIKLWDVATGKELYTFTGYRGSRVMASIVFNQNGKLLAVASPDKTVKIWDIITGTEKNAFAQDNVLVIAFSPHDDKLAAGGAQGVIKIWDTANGKELFTLVGHTDDVLSMAFNDNGEILASSSRDKKIKLWNVRTGKEIRTLKGEANPVGYLAFSGRKELITESIESIIEVWDREKKQVVQTLRGLLDSDTRALISPDRTTLALPNSSEGIKFWDLLTGKQSFEIKWKLASEKREIDDDEQSIFYDRSLMAFGKDKFAVSFLRKRKIRAKNDVAALATNVYAFKVWSFAEEGKLELNSKEIESNIVQTLFFSPDGKWLVIVGDKIWLWNTEDPSTLVAIKSKSYSDRVAISADNSILAVGGHFDKGIRLWDVATQREIGVLRGHTAGIYNLSFQTEKNVLMSQSYDGTAKFWDTATQRELVTLILLDNNDWVVISPDGRFDASPNAMKLMHYVYGLEVITLEQLKDAYYEPGLLAKLIGFSKESLRTIRPLRDVKLYPKIVKQEVKPDSTLLSVTLINRGGGIGPVRIAVNGKTITEDAREKKLRANPFVETATVTFDLKGSTFIKGTGNRIEVFTNNYDPQTKQGYITSRGSELLYTKQVGSSVEPPALYAIIGGISDYAGGSEIDLRFSSKDAEDMAVAINLSGKRLFGADKVHLTVLSTSGKPGTLLPTKENFKKAFAEVAKRARPEDILFIYLSGHGLSLGLNTDTYFYLTQEALSASKESLSNPDVRAATAISSAELIEWLTQKEWVTGEKGIKALKQVMVLDTCAAGVAGEQFNLMSKKELSSDQIRAIERLKDRTGFYVLMGSTADAPSYEASQYGQGLLTYILLQGMRGAALREGEFVDVQRLFQYAADEVPKLAQNIGGIQRPIVAAPLGSSFDMGQLEEEDRRGVPFATVKPILLGPRFSTGEEGDDALNLIESLSRRLEEASYAGPRGDNRAALLVYIREGDFPGGIRVTGTYTITDNTVRIKAFLRRDGKTISTLPEISGNMKDTNSLLNTLMKEILEALLDLN